MLPALILTSLLSVPLTSSTAASRNVFTPDSPGLAQLGDIGVDGDLTVSFKFRTGATEAQLLYLRELSADHFISLSIKDGGLHLQGSVYKGTSIVPRTKDTGEMLMVDDKQWHDVYLTLKDGGQFKYIVFKLDDIEIFTSVSVLPDLSKTVYQTWLGGLPPSPGEETDAGRPVSCVRDIRLLLTDFQDLQITGDKEEECPTLTFQGPMLAVITRNLEVGSHFLKVQAVTGDSSSQIQYELNDPSDYFALDRTTGSLSIVRPVDRTSPNNVLTLIVVASTGIGKY